MMSRGVMSARTQGAVQAELLALLPPSAALARVPESGIGAYLAGPAAAIAAAEAQAVAFGPEVSPGAAALLLQDYERVLGPDPCGRDLLALSPGDRRALAASRWTMRGGQTPAYFVGLAASLGTAITITEGSLFTAGASVAGDAVAIEGDQFAWAVSLPAARLVDFIAGSAEAGDALGSFDVNLCECVIRLQAPAHTTPVFSYQAPATLYDLTGALPSPFTFTRASSATYLDATGTLATAAANVARADHDPVTLAPLGTLLEPAATNALRYSADVSNAVWAKFGAPAVVANAATAPDGTLTAASVALTPVSGFYQQVTASAGQTWIGSIWLRAATPGTYRMAATGSSAGAVTKPVAVTTQWQRFSLGVTLAAGSTNFGLQVDGGGGAGGTIYAWGGQSELGATPSSYIPTTSAAAARAADNLSLALPYAGVPGADGWSAVLAGTFAAAPAPAVLLGLAGAGGFSDTSYINVPTAGSITAAKRVGGAGVSGALVPFAPASGTAFAMGLAQDSTGLQAAFGAGSSQALVSTGSPMMTVLGIGRAPWGGDGTATPLYVRQLLTWPRAIAPAEMQNALAGS